MTTDPLRIPIGRNITYAVRGMPDVPNLYGEGFLVPTEVSLTYRASEDAQLGRLHAYVKGHWRRDGEEVATDQKLPGQHYYGDPDTWPTWLAEEARLHDPVSSAVAQSAPAETALRDRIAAAVWERQNPGRRYADCEYRWKADAEADADAVLAALFGPIPAGTDVATWTAIRAIQLMNEAGQQRDAAVSAADDRAAVYSELADRQTQLAVADDLQRDRAMATARRRLVTELRSLAAEERAEREAQAHLDQLADELPAVTPPPALTEVGRLRAQVEVLQQDAERDQGLAKVGARCMRVGHQGLIERGRAVLEGWRFALSVALNLGTGAPWEAIHERVKELAADPAAASAVSSVGQAAHTTRGAEAEIETRRPAPAGPASTALRVRVLREILARIDGGSEDSATEQVDAATVRAVLAEVLTGMQQQPSAEVPSVALADLYRELADEAAEWGGVITEHEFRRKASSAEQQSTEAETLRCVCGAPAVRDGDRWTHQPGTGDTCMYRPDARPRCPDCRMPHVITPSMQLACASILASIRDRETEAWDVPDARPGTTDHTLTQPVQHAPGVAVLCADCRAKGHTVCMDAAVSQPGKEH